jgi:hypothetical protein
MLPEAAYCIEIVLATIGLAGAEVGIVVVTS